MKGAIILILQKIIKILGGNGNKNAAPKKVEANPIKKLEILVYVDLNERLFTINKCSVDGYVIPNISSPYDLEIYVKNWFVSRRIGDGYLHSVRNFLDACVSTKTNSESVFHGVLVSVKIMNNDQTETKNK